MKYANPTILYNDLQTDKQTDYCNPSCVPHMPRVNYGGKPFQYQYPGTSLYITYCLFTTLCVYKYILNVYSTAVCMQRDVHLLYGLQYAVTKTANTVGFNAIIVI